MKRITVSLVFLLIFSFTGVGYAHNVGAFGPNDLLTIPTADILTTGDLSLNYQRVTGENSQDLVAGVYGLREGVQVGAVINWNSAQRGPQIAPSIKARIISEDGSYRPQLSIGVNGDSNYLVASKSTPYYGLRVHFGVGEEDYFADHAFAGISKVVNAVTVSSGDNYVKLPITTLIAEYNGGVNLGAKFNFEPGVEVNLGVLNLNEFTFGVGFKNKF
ncbi:hypothetical protein Halha_2438 [Halobacteroides halobius DSM 5150]|uniref:Uncharacterized protein n=1 Tax=Halobacteroides halobius (strain ATCC 35273 / DSM 5150 / MD-1) TaxID=748449 RepID=L0KAK5_HALHC|nr:YjbH domain-containing protein [Halobacteroides halobius]AGB42312.1 hypothetical protein Halha_2438 [Halobacteroides halobius DSM 5150]